MRPTASATANRKDSSHGRPRQRFTSNTKRTMQQREPQDQQPEAARAPLERGGRRLLAESRRRCGRGSVAAPCATDDGMRALPLMTDVPMNTALVRGERSSRACGAAPSACFSTGKGSPVRSAWLTKKSRASSRRPSAGTIAGRQQHHVARNDLGPRHVDSGSVAQDRGAEMLGLAKALRRPPGSVLLDEIQHQAQEDHHQDHVALRASAESGECRGADDGAGPRGRCIQAARDDREPLPFGTRIRMQRSRPAGTPAAAESASTLVPRGPSRFGIGRRLSGSGSGHARGQHLGGLRRSEERYLRRPRLLRTPPSSAADATHPRARRRSGCRRPRAASQ